MNTAPGVCVSTAPGVCVCVSVCVSPLLQVCVCVCALEWVKYREHISLMVILCIIVYVTNTFFFLLNKKNIGYRFFFKTDFQLW